MTPDPWFPYRRFRGQARARLFCFSYAGGGASLYRAWQDVVPALIEVVAVQLPGRENRFGEPPLADMATLVDHVVAALRPHLTLPFACFGHSMGALLAYELAHELRRLRLPGPTHLVVSGHEAPHIIDHQDDMHALPDDRFVARLAALNGTPPEILRQPELLELVLPLLRADFRAHETYAYRHRPALECPITAFGGRADPDVSHDALAAWQRHTHGAFALRTFPGDHFFIRSSEISIVAALNPILQTLDSARATPALGPAPISEP